MLCKVSKFVSSRIKAKANQIIKYEKNRGVVSGIRLKPKLIGENGSSSTLPRAIKFESSHWILKFSITSINIETDGFKFFLCVRTVVGQLS